MNWFERDGAADPGWEKISIDEPRNMSVRCGATHGGVTILFLLISLSLKILVWMWKLVDQAFEEAG